MSWSRALVLTCLAALAVSACGGDSGGNDSTSGSPGQAAPEQAVVYVKARYADRHTEGSGFIVNADRGWILTSDHAVEAAPSITVFAHDGKIMHGEVIARAQCNDFAVLALHPLPDHLRALAFGDSHAVRPGARVRTVAYGLPSASSPGLQIVSTTGTVAANDVKATLHPMLPPMAPLIAHQVPLGQGASGAPLLDGHGRVIGMNTLVGEDHGAGTIAGLNYALTSEFLAARLRQLRPGAEGGWTGWRGEHRCHRAMAHIAGVPGGHTDTGHAMPNGAMGGQMQGGHDHHGG
jgi:S1-C subfamily serine protease